jgi:hypothetical protein
MAYTAKPMAEQLPMEYDGPPAPHCLEGTASCQEIAAKTAGMWKGVPTNKMTLPHHLNVADTDGMHASTNCAHLPRPLAQALTLRSSGRVCVVQATARSTRRSLSNC